MNLRKSSRGEIRPRVDAAWPLPPRQRRHRAPRSADLSSRCEFRRAARRRQRIATRHATSPEPNGAARPRGTGAMRRSSIARSNDQRIRRPSHIRRPESCPSNPPTRSASAETSYFPSVYRQQTFGLSEQAHRRLARRLLDRSPKVLVLERNPKGRLGLCFRDPLLQFLRQKRRDAFVLVQHQHPRSSEQFASARTVADDFLAVLGRRFQRLAHLDAFQYLQALRRASARPARPRRQCLAPNQSPAARAAFRCRRRTEPVRIIPHQFPFRGDRQRVAIRSMPAACSHSR